MSKFNRIMLAVTGTIWFLILVTRVGNYFDQKRWRELYERGVWQTVIYHKCMGKYPSAAFRDEEWNLINLPDDCRYVWAIDRELERRR